MQLLQKSALLLMLAGVTLAGVSMAAEHPGTYIGVVHDNTHMQSTPAQQCVIIKGPKYTLQTSDGAWILTDEKLVAPYAGKPVSIRGTITDGNKLHILSIAPASASQVSTSNE